MPKCPVLQFMAEPQGLSYPAHLTETHKVSWFSWKQCQDLNSFHAKAECAEVMELGLCSSTMSRWHSTAQSRASDSKWFILTSESGLN